MTHISLSIFFLVCLCSIELTSSASFPNPPQRPPANATPDEKAMFWKLLHDYYAIIARPRFGKRFYPDSIDSKYFKIENLADYPSSSEEDIERSHFNVRPSTFKAKIFYPWINDQRRKRSILSVD